MQDRACKKWVGGVFGRQPGPRAPSQRRCGFLPPSTLHFLLLPTLSSYSLGNPPPHRQHTLSQGEVEASPHPPHEHPAPLAPARPRPQRGGPSLTGFPATVFGGGPMAINLHQGREAG